MIDLNPNSENLQDWQTNIIGLIVGWGKYDAAARAALDQGEQGVLFAMQAAFNDGYRAAMQDMANEAARALKRHGRYVQEEGQRNGD